MNFKKLIAFILLAATLFSMLAACTTDEPEVTTEATTLPETEPPAPATLVFADNGATDFRVIRSESAQGYYLDTAKAVYQKLKDKLSDDFKLGVDWLSPLDPDPATSHEVLLFSTSRDESAAAMADLAPDSYIIRITDCKVVIVGSTLSACIVALYHFFDFVIPNYTINGKTEFPVGLEIKNEVSAASVNVGVALRAGKTVCADFEILFEYSGKDNFGTAQGAATDGKYVYVAMKKKEGEHETDRIVKIDMATWEIVAESEELPLDHANDMTYDPVNKILIVTNMLNNIVSLIDPEELKITKQKTPAYGSWATGYIDGAGQYVFLAYGTPSGLVITDTDLNPIRSSPLESAPNYIGQGMDADSKFAYVPLSPSTGKSDNIIQIYDLATGEYLGIVSVATKMESESMFHVGDDVYLHFNSSGSKIAKLDFYVRFE